MALRRPSDEEAVLTDVEIQTSQATIPERENDMLSYELSSECWMGSTADNLPKTQGV